MESDQVIFRVGSRKSKLALIQTNKIIGVLKEKFPHLHFEIVTIETTGDRILDVALSKIGEKSLFVRELEDALLSKSIDFIVHSLKDLPTSLPEGLVIGAVYERDDPRDAVVMRPERSMHTLETLDSGSMIGTSSLRRIAQLKKAFPHLGFTDIRGNLNTRLKKLDSQTTGDTWYDAIILAKAGLERMGWQDRISQVLETDVCMYSISQGAIAVECRIDDSATLSLLSSIHHYETTLRCAAERSFLKQLEGGCSVPVGVDTSMTDNELHLTGVVYSIDGSQSIKSSLSVSLFKGQKSSAKMSSISPNYSTIAPNKFDPEDIMVAESLGITLADHLIHDGGHEILREVKAQLKNNILHQT